MLCSSITKKYDMNCSTSVFSYINWIILHYCEVMGYCFIQFVMAFNSLGVWGVADVISVVYVTLGVRYNFLLERCLQLKVFWWAVVLTLYLASGGKARQGRHVQMTPFLVNNWVLPAQLSYFLLCNWFLDERESSPDTLRRDTEEICWPISNFIFLYPSQKMWLIISRLSLNW